LTKIGDKEIFPTKIICLGRNYLGHLKETKAEIPEEPVIFLKTLNCLITNGDNIVYPRILYESEIYNRVDHEIELAFVIKDKCKNVIFENAYDNILGYTIFLDITARKMQIIDKDSHLPWFRSKSFDTFGPIGPRIVSREEIGDPHDLKIELKVNGKIKQSSNTKNLIFKIPYLLEYISSFFTLEPGDIIATGTPEGIGPIQPGDLIEAHLEKIGTLSHGVILEGQ
jgi:2-keto-4-pentenoate hydratase/2-oxohepta-3-ene-1,7-dioic acid hydratase in catechol pathway